MRFTKFLSLWILCGMALASIPVVSVNAQTDTKAKRPNVLFIAVDDLNHWVRYLGRNKQAITPNIDRLARRGVAFHNAYSADAVCNPSRAALMSGVRPSTSGIYGNATDWRKHIPEEITLPTQFRKAGYYVAGSGKIYHGGFERSTEWDDYGKGKPRRCPQIGEDRSVAPIKWGIGDCDDDGMNDYNTVEYTAEQLKKSHDRPFFLAAGIFRPHLPWIAPKKYYDMYPLDKIELPPYQADDLKDLPTEGKRMAGPANIHKNIVESGKWKEAIQAYLASITFADAMIGRILDELDKSAYKDNTIIVLWGDHGWHLGEKDHWRKFTLWEEGSRTPYIWVAPNVTKPDTKSTSPVDLMSVYPTLMELCGIPIPNHVEGVSIKKLLENPNADWKTPAQTTHGFNNHAIRTVKWRYIRYNDGGEELYDEINDPFEWKNLANDAKFESVKKELAQYLPKVNKPAPDGENTSGDAISREGEKASEGGDKNPKLTKEELEKQRLEREKKRKELEEKQKKKTNVEDDNYVNDGE